ncbi:hypothetical protein [Bordetella hinzii]|uniref:hypothetical protein n=1 Tax=Bordetella hinzii TaxID=103855 RepID=UPI0011519041|nr:hypothetical protein [Bordetella hinzii]QDJ44968.1 hypothetical protein CBR71_03660 [Bordetella hinzii]QWF40041.1 hypothetical protein HHA25_18080 [Bordetella hinzii]QWF44588.1 hypothetical protein HHA24_18075 [Bordetella hinzii]QWF49124.1 hypothetical protein HHA23_18075 [Bordetella hinzii]QWF53660.1 hypothetical protein HHA22_18080 [Bordetella hinzii]
MDLPDIPARVAYLERRVDRLFNWGFAALFVTSILGGGYLWFFNKQFDQWQLIQENTQQIKTDLVLMKKEQERQAKEADRAWRLLNAIIKKGPSDVSSSLESE